MKKGMELTFSLTRAITVSMKTQRNPNPTCPEDGCSGGPYEHNGDRLDPQWLCTKCGLSFNDEPSEDELAHRDDRVRDEILRVIREKEALARQMELDARELRTQVARFRASVKREAWYELEAILEDEDIESLCSISPTDLLGRDE
jgi:hypothetical protein